MRGKYWQAIAARTGDWSTGSSTSSGEDRKTTSLEAENKELRARLEALEKKGGEGVQGGQGLPSMGGSGLEEQWGMDVDVEDEIESRKKLDEQKRKLREPQGLQAGGERRGSDVSQTDDCCLEEKLQKVTALGTHEVEVLFQRVRRDLGALPE